MLRCDFQVAADRRYLEYLWSRPVELFSRSRQLMEKTCGDRVSFVINRNINFTNVCTGSCTFCSFHKSASFRLPLEEILRRVAEAEAIGATEICLQGGLNPLMKLSDYCEILNEIKVDFPDMHLHAYSPMEIMHMVRGSGVTVEEALRQLKHFGLGSLPGTAAEILVDSVRDKICPSKLSTDQWRFVISCAHRLGIPTTSTMLYGHIESLSDRLSHLEVLREIQEKTGGFTEFVLLPFLPGDTPLGRVSKGPDLLTNLKMHALSRVVLHPLITNIQASWVKLGRDAAGAAIQWGANDLGGTLMEENISRMAGSREGQYISADELSDLIERHGHRPFQRTTLYTKA